MTKIPHKLRTADVRTAPKGKIPYLKHGENVFGDSFFMSRYLWNTFGDSEAVKESFIHESELPPR